MPDNYKEVVSLTEDLPESAYSGLSNLPEVKDPVAFLTGSKSRGEFRSMILDDVIPERKELPEWATTIEPKTTGEKFIQKTGVLSESIVGGEGTKLNTLGEIFYKLKDGYAYTFESLPEYIGTYIAAATKTAGVAPETSAKALKYFNNLRKDREFDAALEDFRLGVDNEKFTNQLAYMLGNMAGIITIGTVTGSGNVAAGLEGLQEGSEYLATDISAQRERQGGIEQYKGEGLGFATTLGILSGIIGKFGVEARFTESLGSFVGKEALKQEIKNEAATEALQQALGLVSRETQNKAYGTATDQKTPLEGVLEIGKAGIMGAFGAAAVGGIQTVNNMHYMSEELQEKFGLTKPDAKLLARQYMQMSADSVYRNGEAMRDLSPDSRVMQLAKQQLIDDGMDAKQADRVLAKIRRDVIKEQVKKGEELSANDFYKNTETVEDLVAYVRNKAGIQQIEDSVVEEEKQQIEERRQELQAQQQEVPVTEQEVETQEPAKEEQPEQPIVETQEAEEKTSIQNEINFLNAEENAINQSLDIEAPVLPVEEDLLTKQDIKKINDKLEEIDNKVAEISEAKTPVQKVDFEVGKELNSFTKPKVAESKFAKRVEKQTGTELETKKVHKVRDIKQAKKFADDFVANEEDAAWEALEGDRADTRGLLKSEIAEALKRKISKIKDVNERKTKLRRLINSYADVATKAGQELRALADDSLIDAIRDAAAIEVEVGRKMKKAIANKSAKVQKGIDNLVKTDKVMSDKRFWEEIRKKMECR